MSEMTFKEIKEIIEKRRYDCAIPYKHVLAEIHGKNGNSIVNENSEVEGIDEFNKNNLTSVSWPISRLIKIFRFSSINLSYNSTLEIYKLLSNYFVILEDEMRFKYDGRDKIFPDELYLNDLKDFKTLLYERLNLANYKEPTLTDKLKQLTFDNTAVVNKLIQDNLKKQDEKAKEETKHEYHFLSRF